MDPAATSSSAAFADSTSANTSTNNNNSNGTGRKGQTPKRGGGRNNNNNQQKGAQTDSAATPKPKRQDGRNKRDKDSTTAGSTPNPRAPRTIAATDPIDLQTGREATADAENSATTTTTVTAPHIAEDGAEHSCFICTENIVIFAVSDCNHRTCHLCSLRLRALYKTKNCAYCKVTFETTSCLQKRSLKKGRSSRTQEKRKYTSD